MTDEDVKEWEKQLSKLRKDDDRGPRDLERRIDDLMAINKKHQEQMELGVDRRSRCDL